MKKTSILILMATLLLSCKDKVEPPGGIDYEYSTIEVEAKEQVIYIPSIKKGLGVEAVKSDSKPYINKDQDTLIQDWIRVVTFKDKKQIEVKAQENTTLYNREIEFIVTSVNYIWKIEVQQKGKE